MYPLSFSKRMLSMAMIIALIASFSGISSVSAQPTQALIEDWRAPDYNFSARMMDTDASENLYVLGDTVVGDYLVIKKFSATGTLLWQKNYDPTERLRGVWIDADGSGNAIVLASAISGSSATPSGWVTLKYDTDGNLLWTSSLPGPYRDARRVQVDGSDNIYVSGRMWLTNSSGYTSQDSVLIKYSPDGTILWTAIFDNGGAVDEPYSLVISPDDSRIGVAGSSGNMFMALMYDPSGNQLWANTYDTVYSANDLAFGPGNISYFATGTYFPEDSNPYQMAIVSFDEAGNQSWIKSYSVGDRTFRVGVDSQGNILAAGMDVAGYMDWMTIKTDANGNLLWSQRYDGGRNNDETPNMLVIDASDAVYVTGTGGPNPSSGVISYLKGVVAKYNSDGTPQWSIWDDYAGGKAIRLGASDTIATLGWGYLVPAHYTQTGLADLPPNTPTNLTGTIYFTGVKYQVNLRFGDNSNNEYWVEAERCEGSGCTNFTRVTQSRGENATGISDANIARGITYIYRVRALGFMGSSAYSNTVEVFVPPVNPPTAPSNLTAVMSGANVVLNWQDNSTNEIQFYIDRCQGAGCTSFSGLGASGGTNITTWTDTSAMAGMSYSYRVRSWNSDGYSGYSNTATIITPGSSLPAAPTNLVATALNRSQIILTWNNNSTNQDGVRIERCKGATCTNFVQLTIVVGTTTTFSDAGLPSNTSYRYRVRAYNSAGNSPYSNISSAKTLRR